MSRGILDDKQETEVLFQTRELLDRRQRAVGR